MLTLVIGGAASGKSAFAEGLVLARGAGPRYYLATMACWDAECRARIQRHRAQRAQKQFETIERPRDLAGLTLPRRGVVLLEDLPNLAANELYAPDAPADPLPALLQGVESLCRQSRAVVVVSGEVFAEGSCYGGDTDRYLHLLADAHRALAARADAVCEVVCGLPHFYKGDAASDVDA